MRSPPPTRLLASLFSIFGGVAMLLAAVGRYGLMSFAVIQRTNEYGIRMAVGASHGAILRMIQRQGSEQLRSGLALALALAVGLVTIGDALPQNFLFQVSRADPLVWGSIILLISRVTLLACLAPARRATRINPVEALRAE